jgi:hypothetical protein
MLEAVRVSENRSLPLLMPGPTLSGVKCRGESLLSCLGSSRSGLTVPVEFLTRLERTVGSAL